MNQRYQINHKTYTAAELLQFARKQLEQDLPHWQIPLYGFIVNWLDSAPVIRLQTSGSTGKPKIIEAPKEQMRKSARRTIRFFNLGEQHTFLLNLSADYIAGKMMIVRAFECGANLVTIAPQAELKLPQSENYNLAALVPYQIQKSAVEILNRIKIILIGGAAVNHALINKIKQTNALVYETYGMTETYTHIALKQLHPVQSKYFRTLNDIGIKTYRDDLLAIKLPGFADYLYTNDRIRQINDQEFEWLGRIDNTINSGGVKIQPEKIEQIIANALQTDFFVDALPDKQWGQKMVVFVESEFSLHENERLYHFFRQNLKPHEIPGQIIFVNPFRRTFSGKIDKIATRETWQKR